ncbi:MAG: PD40 domain-containing protein, partial [Prevotella sp.]|nr:PD40 domain-containing protein [Prevotella sp.]
MNKALTFAVAATMLAACGTTEKETQVNIERQTVELTGDQMTPEALWAMSRIAGYAASPDGSKVVYQMGYYSVEHNKSHQVLWVMNADGSDQKQLTADAASETDPAWLDNETIAFMREGEVWKMDANGGSRRQLSDTEGSVEGFKFSPNGKRVILLKSLPFNDIIDAKPEDLPLTTGRVVNDLMYRHWDHYVESIMHPFVADFDGNKIGEGTDILDGEPYECPMEPFGGIEQLDFSADGELIAYTCRKKIGKAYSISTDSDIYLYTMGTGETTNLCKPADYVAPEVNATKTLKYQSVNSEENLKNNPGYDQNPKFSPDGKYVAWTSMARDGYEADRLRLCCYNLETGEKQYLTESFDSNVDDFCWSDDNEALIYFIGVWHATENLYAVTKDMQVKQLTNEWADFGSLQMMNNGKQLLMERHSYVAPADLYVVTPNTNQEDEEMNVAEVKQITEVNKDILDKLAKPTMDQRWVKTTDVGEMLYWIILPPNFDETK